MMTQQEHDELMLSVCEENIADCERQIEAIGVPHTDNDRFSLRGFTEALISFKEIREELLARLEAA